MEMVRGSRRLGSYEWIVFCTLLVSTLPLYVRVRVVLRIHGYADYSACSSKWSVCKGDIEGQMKVE